MVPFFDYDPDAFYPLLDDGCLSVIPGSHFPFREALETSVEELVFAELFKL